MNKLKFSLLAILLVFTSYHFAKAQTANAFVSYSGGFSINLPDDIRGGGSNGTAGGINLTWQQPEANYEIGFYETQGLPLAKVGNEFSFDEMVRIYFNKFSSGGEEIYSKKISSQENEGREYKYKTKSSLFILRLYSVNDRIYKVLAEIPSNKPTGEEKVMRVFDSFRLLDKKAVETAMAKKIANATPKELPQTPVAAKLKSDVQDRSLKGNVKSVLTELALYGLKDSLRKKQSRLFEEFNNSGNLLKQIEYNSDGNASTIRVFGYVAGKRVSRSGDISYESEPGGIMLGFPASAKSDKRFDESYTYKYVGENLIEERTLFSNGVMYRRAAFRYLKGKKELSYYGEGAKPFQTIIFTLDEKGNEIEMTVTSSGGMYGKKTDRFKIEYESFDDKGNWTKRNISQWYGLDNSGSFQPESVEYRTVNYFE